MPQLVLRVVEAEPRFIGKHVVRIHKKFMDEFSFKIGDCVEIGGTKPTGAVLGPEMKSGDVTDDIQMDARIRRNAGVTLDDNVSVSPASVNSALEVNIALIVRAGCLIPVFWKMQKMRSFDRGQLYFIKMICLSFG